MPAVPHVVLDDLARSTPELQFRLRRHFPTTCSGHIEDAVQHALVVACTNPDPILERWSAGGVDAALKLLTTIAWRFLRGHWRRAETRAAAAGVFADDSATPLPTPENHAAGLQTAQLVDGLIIEASERFGGSNAPALAEALQARLYEGGSDAGVARAFAVRREYINRARRWIGAQLQDLGLG